MIRARSEAIRARCALSCSSEKYSRPSTNVRSHRDIGLSGEPDHTARSASFPSVIEPTLSSIFSCFAGLIVTNASASLGSSPPYFTALPASAFIRRASSSESELKLTVIPASCMIAPSYGIASYTSHLYAHQSLKHDPPIADLRIASATLYPSSTCWNVPILKPKSSATRQSIRISSCR